MWLTVLFAACAPQNGDEAASPDAVPTAIPDAPIPARDSEDGESTPGREPEATPVPEAETEAETDSEAVFDPENPDWSLRYRMLKEKFHDEFEPKDVVGKTLKIPLASGEARTGTITALEQDSLDLEFENGSMNLPAETMREDAQKYFFREYYARLNAAEQAKAEHAKWTAMQERESTAPEDSGKSDPQGTKDSGAPSDREFDSRNPDGLRHGYRPNPNAEPPRNEGPKGLVPEVDDYLRRKSALPESVRYKKWFPVQKHGEGYKVRVQYSVESAGGLGTSNEDMMFFMYADGKVYQRAAVR